MKKRITALALMVVLIMSCSMSVFAAPKKMSDGTIFDAAYYAEQNKDVVEAVGNTEEALYKHYVEFGKKEGRLPYEGAKIEGSSASASKANSTAAQNSKSVTASTTSNEESVWLSATGKCYHRINNCGTMNPNKATKVTKSEAESRGKSRCKNCW